MDIDINKVLLVGTIEEIGELRTFPTGSTLCPVTVLTVERFTRRDGEVGERKSYHKVTLWGGLGKRVHAEFSRGMRVAVEGRLSRSSVERDGQTQWYTNITATSFNAMGAYSGTSQRSESRPASNTAPSPAQSQPATASPPPPPAAAPPSDRPPLPDDDDDLPF